MMKRTLLGFFAGALALLAFVATPVLAQAPNAPPVPVHVAQNQFVSCCDLQSLPTSLTIHRGDSITLTAKFSAEIGLFDPAYTQKVVTMDRRAGEVLKLDLALKRLSPDTIQIAHISTLRDGWAEIQIERFDGKVVHTIKVIVQ